MVASVSVLVYVLQIMAEWVRDCLRHVVAWSLRAGQLVPEAALPCVNASHTADAEQLPDSNLQVEAFGASVSGNGTCMVSSMQCH